VQRKKKKSDENRILGFSNWRSRKILKSER